MQDLVAKMSAPTLEWLPAVSLVILLWCQPWRQFDAGGSVAAWLGLSAAATTAAGLILWPHEPGVWAILALLHFWWILKAYYVADNHYYLMGYWCVGMAIALAVGGAEGETILAESSRLLIGACFLLATLVKLVNRRFRDGSFFMFTIMTDRRFLPVAWHFGRVSQELRAAHIKALSDVAAGRRASASAPVTGPLRRVSTALTWCTLVVEGTVAAVFLLPLGVSGFEVGALVLFAVCTYALAPVSPFGQILLVMALALPQPPVQRAVVLALAVLLPLVANVSVSIRASITRSLVVSALPSTGHPALLTR